MYEDSRNMKGGMMGDMMWEQEWWSGEQDMMMGAWAASGNRLLLAQTDDLVVADTSGQLVGGQLLADDMARGVPILLNGRPAGILIVTNLDILNQPDKMMKYMSRYSGI
jgi:hypothetical protein